MSNWNQQPKCNEETRMIFLGDNICWPCYSHMMLTLTSATWVVLLNSVMRWLMGIRTARPALEPPKAGSTFSGVNHLTGVLRLMPMRRVGVVGLGGDRRRRSDYQVNRWKVWLSRSSVNRVWMMRSKGCTLLWSWRICRYRGRRRGWWMHRILFRLLRRVWTPSVEITNTPWWQLRLFNSRESQNTYLHNLAVVL